MRPLKLTMQAFGSYGKKTPPIDFTKLNQNLFLITGDTGAGKTTIFDAMIFALYGEASSGSNKKDGTELQSQFVGYDVKPFVELVFSEKNGEQTEVYTVRRIPRHVRMLKRGSGVKEERGSVSLIMPDGTEYPQKETDQKLEEIVGLSKGQFMQVAMIAQGEFMELLRASSDNKKVIFRRLFHTEIFQNIVNEFDRRRKEKYSDIAQMHTICKTEAAHISVPEDYEEARKIGRLKDQIVLSDKISVTNMERLLDALKALCDKLENRKDSAQKAYNKASQIRDEKRDAWIHAQSLIHSFEQLKAAEDTLAECRAQEEVVQETEKQIAKIYAAYEVKVVYQRFLDAQEMAVDIERKLREKQKILPELEETYRTASAIEKEAENCRSVQRESFAKVFEQVKKALDILSKIQCAQKDVEKKEQEYKEAVSAKGKAQKRLEKLEGQEQEWRRQSEELGSAQEHLITWKRKKEEAEELAKEIAAAKRLQQDVDMQRERTEKAQQDYERARQKFFEKNREYIEVYNAFFDMQAGLIAREKLKEGKPCPVCGAVEHPHPCTLSKEHQHLTREMVDDLAEKAAGLQREQQDKSSAAGTAAKLLEEKANRLEETFEKLWNRMKKSGLNMTEECTMEQAQQRFFDWRESIDKESESVQKHIDTLEKVRKSLKGIDEKKRVLREEVQTAAQRVTGAAAALAGSQSVFDTWMADRDYATKEEAKEALKAAEAAKREKEAAYMTANQQAEETKQKYNHACVLVERYTKELPIQREEQERRRIAYETMIAEKRLSEADWISITKEYVQSEAARFQERVDGYNRRKAMAEGMRQSARQAIGDQERPDVERAEQEMEEAKEKLEEAQRKLEQCREVYKVNADVYYALVPKLDERSRAVQDYARIESLYNRLAGKVTGSRMDIETFVQRYYLQKILRAANLRFRDMTAGQFELRMFGEEQAGGGKNRGLDLMVYSAVTGKEREVRTLSGGESFMAALSLALGMADQIQENSAAVNLDVMFIDEGFGSLDEHSRNQAVRVLQQMAGGSKMIGIISHVTELKQEIEDQLLVSRDREGSHIKWQIS